MLDPSPLAVLLVAIGGLLASLIGVIRYGLRALGSGKIVVARHYEAALGREAHWQQVAEVALTATAETAEREKRLLETNAQIADNQRMILDQVRRLTSELISRDGGR